MDYIASPSFDAQTMMGTLPITHYVNEALDNHAKGISKSLLDDSVDEAYVTNIVKLNTLI